MDEIAPGIHRWTAPHPEWRTNVEEVVSYALRSGTSLLLVDPLLPTDAARRKEELSALDELVGRAERIEVLVTIPFHARSAEALHARYAPRLPARIWGHAKVRTRLSPGTPLEVVPSGRTGSAAPVAGGAAEAYTIGKPRRSEHPYYIPGLRAVAFGDAVVGLRGGLRFWNMSAGTGAAWYRDVFAPTVRRLAERDIEHVLVTHGPPVLGGGRRALEACLAAPPVDLY